MSLRDSAMLVDLRLTCFTGARTHKRTGEELTEAKNAEAGSASVIVKMVPNKYLKKIRAVDTAMRLCNRHFTLPWGEETRLLPSAVFFEHSQKIDVLMTERRKEINEFRRVFPALKAEAPYRLKDLYVESMWPDSIDEFFSETMRHYPIPAGEDFRLNMDENDLAKIKAEVEVSVNAQLHEAMGAARLRIVATIQEFVDRIKDYEVVLDVDGPRTKGVFRDSVMQNLLRLADVLPALNLTNDPVITDTVNAIRSQLTVHNPDTLRDDDAVRRQVVAQAKTLINNLA